MILHFTLQKNTLISHMNTVHANMITFWYGNYKKPFMTVEKSVTLD